MKNSKNIILKVDIMECAWKVEPEEVTVLSSASGKGRSLRTTVPMSIVKHFRLREKDKLKWEIRAENNNLLIVVTPLKKQARE
jgi:hypothetical protein